MKTALQTLDHQAAEITDEHVSQFMSLVNEGVAAWIKAGKLLVQMVERNPNTYAIIRKANPQLSIEILLSFEKMGRNQIYPYLLLEDSPGSAALASLPYDLQVEHYKTGVPVFCGWKGNTPIIERKQISALSKTEAKRVFSPSGLRTVDEQKKLFPRTTTKPSSNGGSARSDAPVTPTPRGKVDSLGFYRLVIKFGKPQLVQIPAKSPGTRLGQRVLLEESMGEMAGIVELTRWSKS